MRKALIALLLAALCLLSAGCGRPDEVENQAYALLLGIDREADGSLRLTARVPRVGNENKSEKRDSPSGGAYLTFSAGGIDWIDALQALQWATPRRLNLSHIEIIAVSQALAREGDFPELVRRVAETPHLYTTARFVVCEGSAGAFVEAGKTVIGSQLSSELKAMLRHYADEGYIPDVSFSDLYYATNSVYSDPVAIWGYCENAAERPSEPGSSASTPESPVEQRYAGAALFCRGRFQRALDLKQTAVLNCVSGRSDSIKLEIDGKSVELTLTGEPIKRVDVDGDAVRVRLDLSFATPDTEDPGELRRAGQAIQAAAEEVIGICRELGTDPMGFAEIAVGKFATLSDWLRFDWRRHFAGSEATVSVRIRPQTQG